jgi:hypothetical protein
LASAGTPSASTGAEAEFIVFGHAVEDFLQLRELEGKTLDLPVLQAELLLKLLDAHHQLCGVLRLGDMDALGSGIGEAEATEFRRRQDSGLRRHAGNSDTEGDGDCAQCRPSSSENCR